MIQATMPPAGTRGVTLAHEHHGGITATPAELLRLVEMLRRPIA